MPEGGKHYLGDHQKKKFFKNAYLGTWVLADRDQRREWGRETKKWEFRSRFLHRAPSFSDTRRRRNRDWVSVSVSAVTPVSTPASEVNEITDKEPLFGSRSAVWSYGVETGTRILAPGRLKTPPVSH